MKGYLAGSSGSVSFTVRSYGEIIWSGPDTPGHGVFITWLPADADGDYLYTSTGGSPYMSLSYLGTCNGFLSLNYEYVEFNRCNWTDIITNKEYYRTRGITSSTPPGAFEFCSTLRTATLYNLQYCERRMFYSCPALYSISLPVCTGIGELAFAGCQSLESISLPACQTIGSHAFIYCYNLSAITLGYSSVVRLYSTSTGSYSTVFSYTKIGSNMGSIYVPSSLTYFYKANSCWSYFEDRIFPIE